MASRHWNAALWLIGAASLVASIAWWWVVYRQVVATTVISMPRAVPCLFGASDLCTLAQALCTSSDHFLGIRHYQTFLFWTGCGVVAAAAMTQRHAASLRTDQSCQRR